MKDQQGGNVNNVNNVIASVREFILANMLVGEEPSALTTATPLITSGILDSLQRLDLVEFLEKSYGIEIMAHEMDPSRMDTLEDIANLVLSKNTATP